MIRLIAFSVCVALIAGIIGNGSKSQADEPQQEPKQERKINPMLMRGPGPVITKEAQESPWDIFKTIDKDTQALFDKLVDKDVKGVSYEPIAVAVHNIGIQKYCFICISKTNDEEKPQFGFSAIYIVKGMGVPAELVDVEKIDLEDD